MGMFDSIYVPCPACGASTEFQSKAGECSLMNYTLEDVPEVVLADLCNQKGEHCPKCDTYFGITRAVARPNVTLMPTVATRPGTKDPGMVDKAWAAIENSGVRAGQLWRHNKTDSTYVIKELSVDEMRLVAVVTYEGHPNSERRKWTRDLSVFTGKREDDDSPRFTLVSEIAP